MYIAPAPMQIFKRAKGEWGRVAKRYRKFGESALASPLVEFDGRRYRVINYVLSLEVGQFPLSPVRGTLVVRDDYSVVDDPRLVYTLVRAAFILVGPTHAAGIELFERRAFHESLESFSSSIEPFTQNVVVLRPHVSQSSLQELWKLLTNEIPKAMAEESKHTRMALQSLGLALRQKAVDIRLIEAFLEFEMESTRHGIRRLRLSRKASSLARSLAEELIVSKHKWLRQCTPQEGKRMKAATTWLKRYATGLQKLLKDEDDKITQPEELAAVAQRDVQIYRAPLRSYSGVLESYPIRGVEEIIAALPSYEEQPLWPPPGRKMVAQKQGWERIAVGCGAVMGIGVLLLVVYGFIELGPSPFLIGTALLIVSLIVGMIAQYRRF